MDNEPEPHLVLHKVRGAPAFDIAELIGHDEDGTEVWIIPTSGHRAYPYWHHSLEIPHDDIDYIIPMMPGGWPDHYTCNNPSTKLTESGANLLDRLGLTQKVDRRF